MKHQSEFFNKEVKGINMTRTVRGRLGRSIVAAATTLVLGISLAACSSESPADNAGGGNAAEGEAALEKALEEGGELTYWSWTPSGQDQVDAFMKEYPNVKVNLVNAGTNTEEYTKLQNTLKAGTGAPDVVQIEYYAIPQFALSGGLVDLTQYGFSSLKDDYAPGPWSGVTVGDAVYGLPQDSGPMALFYNKELFDKHDIEVPSTWDEYIAAAKKLNDADPTKFITTDTGDAGMTTSMIWQAGGRPFSVDGTSATINLADEGTKKYTDMWQQLIDQDLLADIPGWTDEWYKGLGDGTIASLISGAWMPGVLQGSVSDGNGKWAVAPIPTYDGQPVTSENGGGAQAVTSQSKNPALAAAFLKWLNNSETSIDVFLASGGFPATTADLNSDEFKNQESEYFGGQKINEVLSAASASVSTGWQYLPYQVYGISIFGDSVSGAYTGNGTLQEGLTAWQDQLVTYGNSQGFSVNK